MFDYSFFIILIIFNFVLFSIFFNIAKKIGLFDKSKKFNNPVTVTSAGIIIYINLLTIFIFTFFLKDNFLNNLPNNFLFTLIGLTVLVTVSTLDDIKPIDPKVRLFFQLICAYISLTSIAIYQLEIPLKISILICLCLWVYILNITNFTDGSDGFLATNTIFLFVNLIFLDHILNLDLFSNTIAIGLLPSIIIFLYFNKPNAKLYLGDGGSILIGFINGFIFLELLTNGRLNLAISLLIYPFFDCTLALIRKTFQGKLPWADTSNYSFLQPTIKKNKNKFFVFYINIIFNIFNSILIFSQLYFGWFVIFLNILLSLLFIRIYEKKT